MINTDHQYRINEVLSIIHRDISADLSAKKLAIVAAYSEQHFHRLFKKVTGESLHQYIRRTRLEAAANQLIFSPEQSIQTIAETCGFSSLSSFSRAFRSTYQIAPGQWRMSHFPRDEEYYLSDVELSVAYQRIQTQLLPTPSIVMLEPRKVAYIRHKGYGRSIKEPWEVLKAWALSENRSMDVQIGLHHSNPALTPLDECHYVACVEIDRPVIRRGKINTVVIPGGLHAAFSLKGHYGELLPYIRKMYTEWLPTSVYAARTTPAFATYQKNQFLSTDDAFELTFYLPLSY